MRRDGEIRADAAGAIRADWSTQDLGHPTAAEAIATFSSFEWAKEIQRSDEREANGDDAAYPSMTFRIRSEHVSIDSGGDAERFDLEICLTRPKRLLGIFVTHRFFEAKAILARQVCDVIRVFYELDSQYRTPFFENLVLGTSEDRVDKSPASRADRS